MTPETLPAAPDTGALINEFLKIVQNFGTAGWLVSLGAAVLLLTQVTKLPFLDRWLSKPVWLRPAISAGLGALGGFLSGFAMGGLPKALMGLVAGAMSGFAAIGVHQFASRLSTSGSNEVEAGRVLKTFVASSETEIDTKAAELHAVIDTMAKESDKKKRLAALAALGNRR
jgi:hypothetical protein